jgi:hypothetical protein
MRAWWVVAVLVLASGCGRAEDEPAGSSCDAPFAQGEFGSDYAVVATLAHPPALGETATLTVGVCAKKTARSSVSVRLRDGFEWRTPPEGTTVTTRPAPYGGCEQTATGERSLSAMVPVELVGTVVATREGPAEVAGFAAPATAGTVFLGNSAYMHVTVGAGPGSSHFGYPEGTSDASASPATTPPVPVCD